jgi:hypothetical protein
MFLTWYACSEPGYLTGLSHEVWRPSVFEDLFQSLGGGATTDPEVMFVMGVMASIFPDCCGEEAAWRVVGTALGERYEALPAGLKIDATTFEARGAYGDYFAHMWRHKQARSAHANSSSA